ncbi:MAG: 30S ribosomal protein S6 [Phycisphaerales bacterium]|nr:30S ribosomal protein S6 [Phycisphaerales bacterium]
MTDHNVYEYEAMFVFPQSQTSDMAGAVKHIEEIINRSEAELIALSKWGEKNLATPIDKNKRGLFLLAYFRARGTRMANIERDCNLSEMISRFLIIRADHLTIEEMQATDGRDNLSAESSLRSEGSSREEREPVGAAAGDDSAPASAE